MLLQSVFPLSQILRCNRQRIRKIPLKSTISEGLWSEWRDSNARLPHPKCGALPTGLHPDIHFPAMIPRRGVKIKIFLSVVIYVVKAAFVPFSAIGGKPAIARVVRPSGLLSKPRMDRVYALPNLYLNLQRDLLRALWRFPSLLRFLFGTLLACLFQPPLSPFGICVGLNSVY